MRVVFAAPGTRNYYGIPKYFYTLCKFLETSDVKTTFILDSVKGVEPLREISPKTTPVVLWPEANGSLSTLQFSSNVSRWLKSNYYNYDIFHCSHITPFFYLRSKEHLPVVFQPFGNEVYTLYWQVKGLTRLKFLVGRYFLKYCARSCDQYISEGDFQNSQIEKDFSISNYKAVSVGIDVKEVQSYKEIQNYRTEKGLRDKYYKILAVNSFIDYERMDLLIYSFKKLHDKIPESNLTIIGSGPTKNKVIDIVKKLGVQDSVFFFSNIPEKLLYKFYNISDVFVYTGAQRDFIMGILEAMAAGLPIVSVGQPWLIDGNGYYIDSPSSENIADALFKCYWTHKGLSSRSREIVQQYDMGSIAQEFIEIYKTL